MKDRRWRVKRIDVDPEKGVYVTLAVGLARFRLLAPDFGLGQLKETAALARFTAKTDLSGGFDVEEIFSLLSTLPTDYEGPLPL